MNRFRVPGEGIPLNKNAQSIRKKSRELRRNFIMVFGEYCYDIRMSFKYRKFLEESCKNQETQLQVLE